MHRFKDLKVWKEAIALAKDVYVLTKTFPEDERFGLISQLRRAVISISSNIAEGAGRNNKKEFNQFIGIALASSFEVESQLIVSSELGFCKNIEIEQTLKKINHVQNMLYKLQKAL